MRLNILIVRDRDDQRIALCKLLNATFSQGHFWGTKTIAEAVALASSFIEPPEMILVDVDCSDMSIESAHWVKAALPTSQIILLIQHKDRGIDTTKTEASALLFKHQVIPFLTRLFDNMGEAVRKPEPVDKFEGALAHRSHETKAGFNRFMRRVYSRTVHSCANPTKTEG
jgi:DNA-binding NtrC family response regulator